MATRTELDEMKDTILYQSEIHGKKPKLSKTPAFGTCTVCYHAKALLSQAMIDSSIVSFNCGHGVTDILDDSEAPNILKPISMNTITRTLKKEVEKEPDAVIGCLLCKEVFPTVKNDEKSPLLAHLLTEHKIVIADVEKIADFNSYINYWSERFSSVGDITQYCVVINSTTGEEDNLNTGKGDKAPQEKYFLLTDFLPEDHLLRNKLNIEKLSKILDEQQAERTDSQFSRCCLFCKVMFHGNRAELFRHMAVDHGFNVGNADNIIHAAEYIDVMKSKLDNFICLFCEKEFKDWNIMKDHMRKKGHKRIDPKNKKYDKYYLINYLDPGKNWKELKNDPEYEREDMNWEEDIWNEQEWEEWTQSGEMISLCLFCSQTDEDVNKVLSHMKNDHDFDLHTIKVNLGLNFYHQVKIVNYIRKQVYQNKCPLCLDDLKTKDNLNEHLFTERHYGLPLDRNVWDQPVYFFPTFDDDTLLCFLEDDIEDDENQNISLIV